MEGVAQCSLKRHKGKQGGHDGLEHADLLGKEHTERHANWNDDLHVPREELTQSNPSLHISLRLPLPINAYEWIC